MKYHVYILSLALTVLAASCIREGRQDCYSELDLYFSYCGDGATQIFDQRIGNVDLFVFDESYDLIRQETYGRSALTKKQGAALTLSPGTYHFLGVGNVCDETVISDMSSVTSLFDIYYENRRTSSGVVSTCGALFSSMITVTITDVNERYQETMEFDPLHYRIRMEVTGSDVDENWDLQVRSSAGRIYNDLRYGLDVTVTPETIFAPEDHMLYSAFYIFRQPGRDFIFDFIDPAGETVCSVGLFEFLERYPEIDLDKKDVYISIRLRILKDEIGVIIPEWGIIPVTPQW